MSQSTMPYSKPVGRHSKGTRGIVGLAALLAVLVGACTSYRAPQDVEPSALPAVVEGPYRVQVADRLTVTFADTPEFDSEVTVGPDGRISLPLIGTSEALGRTLEDLTAELTRRYSEELITPRITVGVAEYATLAVYVGGEVNDPGLLPYRGGTTLVQALMEAGGFKETARLKQVVLIRKGRDREPVGTVVDVKEILRKASFSDDVALAPADIVFVPRSPVAEANLWMEQYFRDLIPINISYFLGFSDSR